MSDGDYLPVPIEDPTSRAWSAYKLRQTGLDWRTVADKCGYKNSTTARLEVKTWLERTAANLSRERRLEALEEELDRLDALQEANWHQAIAGDVKATEAVLKVIDRRIKLLGLDTLYEGAGQVTHNTLIVTGAQDEFIDQLRDFHAP